MSPSGFTSRKQVLKLPRFKAESFIANYLCTDYFKAAMSFLHFLRCFDGRLAILEKKAHLIMNRNLTSLGVRQVGDKSANGYINQ